jgi:MEMO1 family protein
MPNLRVIYFGFLPYLKSSWKYYIINKVHKFISLIERLVFLLAIVYGAVMPHPPLIIPIVGGKRVNDVLKTKKALEEVGKRLKTKEIDTVVIFTPHGNVSQVSIPVYVNHVFEGNMGYFGADKPIFSFKGDAQLGNEIIKEARKMNIDVSHIGETFLDHGVIVPMFYPTTAGFKKPIVPIALSFLPFQELYAFGEAIKNASETLNKKVAIIASADLSHRLTLDAPAGYRPEAKKFDEEIQRLVKINDAEGILNLDPNLIEAAGECGLRSIIMLYGAMKGLNLETEILSYESPFGVGYMVATLDVK